MYSDEGEGEVEVGYLVCVKKVLKGGLCMMNGIRKILLKKMMRMKDGKCMCALMKGEKEEENMKI